MKKGSEQKLKDDLAWKFHSALKNNGRGPVAFVAVITSDRRDAKIAPFSLGLAVANEPGYHPVPIGWARFQRMDHAEHEVDRLNRDVLGIGHQREFEIVASTMGGKRYAEEPA